MTDKKIEQLVCCLQGKIKGVIYFTLISDNRINRNEVINVYGQLCGFEKPETKHGFHIHRTGDLSEGCKSLCNHYDNGNHTHGGLNDKNSHSGDLGNISISNRKCTDCDKYLSQKINFIVPPNKFSLKEIVGRSIVIHEGEDDLGKGNNKESLKTGNAGKRIGCGVIGIREEC